ncbi:hypothetical protein b23_0031 [Synechococcus phage B23]|nr:hypothetical protein b23_0031 [Synechococcus phage B23]
MKAPTMETTNTEEFQNLYELLDEKEYEKEQERYYPEFDDQT